MNSKNLIIKRLRCTLPLSLLIFFFQITNVSLVAQSPPQVFDATPKEAQSTSEKRFTALPSSQTNITFANDLAESNRFNIIKYLYYYNGGGVAVGDLNGDLLPDLFFTANELPDRLYLNKGNFQFEDISDIAGINIPSEPAPTGNTGRWKTGVTFADVNGDGWLDIYVCEVGRYKSVNGRNRLYINNGGKWTVEDGQIMMDRGGEGRIIRESPTKFRFDFKAFSVKKNGPVFTEKAAESRLDFKGFSQQAAFFDYDLDGDLDMFLLTHSVHSSTSYEKADQRSVRDSMAGDFLFRNDGGKFVDVSEQAGIFGGSMGYGLGLVVSDLNNDNWPDIYVTNDFHENDYLYLNNGDGTFTENIKKMIGHTSTFSMGVDATDVNNDGLPDLMTLDMRPEFEPILKASVGADKYNFYQTKLGFGYHYQFPKNCLQITVPKPSSVHAQPSTVFSEIGEMAGVASTDWSWSTLMADFDNDGWKDIFVTNGIWRRPNDLDYLNFASNDAAQMGASDAQLIALMPSGNAKNYAFKNEGKAGLPLFQNVSENWGLDLEGCSNGAAYSDLDNDGDLDIVVNNLNAPASVYRNNIQERAERNFFKLALRGDQRNYFAIGAKVYLYTNGKMQMQEVSPVKGWQSYSEPVLFFGLGSAQKVDSIHVVWPNDSIQITGSFEANDYLIYFKNSLAPLQPNISKPSIFYPADLPFSIPHKENRFVDFNIEPLMPHKLSTQGPKIAVGDVDGDGVDDFYLCGAKAQAGQLAVRSGQFAVDEQSAFDEDFLCEDSDAAFFDADGDGDLDLYVASGGGEYREGAKQLQDRLYLNDGKGNFSKATSDGVTSSHPVTTNSSCVVPADFNGDGAIDLFVGSRSVPGSYGLSPNNHLFINDGKGNFEDKTATLCPDIQQVGMVTSAVWLPNERRLVVAGEWMPLTTIDFSTPIPHPSSPIPKTSGWWNALAAADMDGDGDLDVFAGNNGTNTTLFASPEKPMELFVKDFDDNLTTDPIMTFYRQGKRYTVAGKDDLVGQLPMLKKRFLKYGEFAKSPFEAVFDEKILEGAVHKKVETLESAYLENLGDGQFKMTPLPKEAQVAPIFAFLPGDFDGDGKMDVLAAGNFYENQPFIGRQDASFGLLLRGDGMGNYEPISADKSGLFLEGEIRDLKTIEGADGQRFIMASRNNGAVVFFEIK